MQSGDPITVEATLETQNQVVEQEEKIANEEAEIAIEEAEDIAELEEKVAFLKQLGNNASKIRTTDTLSSQQEQAVSDDATNSLHLTHQGQGA